MFKFLVVIFTVKLYARNDIFLKNCKSLSSAEFLAYYILKIIRNLNSNKLHSHNMISVQMLKNCEESICKSLAITFRSCLENRKFPSKWKKSNVVLVFKKNNKQELKNCRPILY